MNLRRGDTIPLKFQLSEGDTGKYVRAFIRDSADSPISGSPFNLSHVANGLYTSDAAIMPETKNVSVQFITYSDSGYTTRDTDYPIVAIEIPLSRDSISGEVVGYVDSVGVVKGVIDSVGVVSAFVCECD